MTSAPTEFTALNHSMTTKKKHSLTHTLNASMTEGKFREFCHVCKAYFSFTNKKQVCAVCELAVCKTDSLRNSQGRVCRSCRREQVNQAIAAELKPDIDSRYAELQKQELTQTSLQAKLTELTDRIRVTEAEQHATTEQNEAAMTSLRNALTLQHEINESLATKIQELESIYKSLGSRVTLEASTLDDLRNEQLQAQTESEELIQDNRKTSEQLNELFHKLQNLMGLRELKELVCGSCYCKLKVEVQCILHPSRRSQLQGQSEAHCKRCTVF